MIVFDLKCGAANHVFEAWFASSAAYEDQKSRKLLACPMCGSNDVTKALMTPNVSTKGNRQISVPVAKTPEPGTIDIKAALSALAKAQAEALKDSTWVGRDFDSQARAMDAGEVDHSRIHGEVSPAEAKALIEDGISVLPLPLPVIPPRQSN